MTQRIVVRPAEPGDGDEMARIWVETGRYYAGLSPELFQVPSEEGLARGFETRPGPTTTGASCWWPSSKDG
jgi:hypothetical protein